VGCGYGRDSKIFLDKGHKVIGIDASEELLKIAKEYEPRLETKLMDIRDIVFPENYFDAIWCSAVLHHIAKGDAKLVLIRLIKMLKKDGICYVIVREGTEGEVVKDEKPYGFDRFFSGYTLSELKKTCKKVCFNILKSGIYNEGKNFKTGRNINYAVVFLSK
jgi:2-polyprenyl-3-methyl-5-hydroxy-6-metoxy-1,4-benzoquinol methylase